MSVRLVSCGESSSSYAPPSRLTWRVVQPVQPLTQLGELTPKSGHFAFFARRPEHPCPGSDVAGLEPEMALDDWPLVWLGAGLALHPFVHGLRPHAERLGECRLCPSSSGRDVFRNDVEDHSIVVRPHRSRVYHFSREV